MKPYLKYFLLLPVLVVYGVGMFIDIMAVDAAQYAVMSMEMIDTGNYLQLYYRGEDYIDKPPLIFWASALSFKLFGISNFAYKLPSVLFALLGLFATYRLGTLMYNRNTGFYAVLILASCQASFMMNQDVKTDTILAACTIVGIWQLAVFTKTKRRIHILWAGLGIAGAMLTKGPIGLMVPTLAIGSDYMLKREWKMFFRWEWLLLIGIILLCLMPMMYGLYMQFDQSTGKQTYNGFVTSGLRFYFWTQSFGRITGESSWQNKSDPFYFAHTFLWAFLPWTIYFLFAFGKRLQILWKEKFRFSIYQEGITLGGIIFPFIAFSLSHYKLPHYIFVTFPLIAILTAQFLNDLVDNERYMKLVSGLKITHGIIAILLMLLVIIICLINFPMDKLYLWIIAITALLLIIYFLFNKNTLFNVIVLPCFIAIVTVNLLFNAHVFPELLLYQSESVVAQKVKKSSTDFPLVGYKVQSYSLDFYYRKEVHNINSMDKLEAGYKGQTLWVFTNEMGYQEIKSSSADVLMTDTLQDYPVSQIKSKFFNPSTRKASLELNYLMLIKI